MAPGPLLVAIVVVLVILAGVVVAAGAAPPPPARPVAAPRRPDARPGAGAPDVVAAAFAGAGRTLPASLGAAGQCGGGRVAVYTAGTVEAYASPTSRRPCAVLRLGPGQGSPVVGTPAGQGRLEAALAAGCGRARPGWYVARLRGLCAARPGGPPP